MFDYDWFFGTAYQQQKRDALIRVGLKKSPGKDRATALQEDAVGAAVDDRSQQPLVLGRIRITVGIQDREAFVEAVNAVPIVGGEVARGDDRAHTGIVRGPRVDPVVRRIDERHRGHTAEAVREILLEESERSTRRGGHVF